MFSTGEVLSCIAAEVASQPGLDAEKSERLRQFAFSVSVSQCHILEPSTEPFTWAACGSDVPVLFRNVGHQLRARCQANVNNPLDLIDLMSEAVSQGEAIDKWDRALAKKEVEADDPGSPKGRFSLFDTRMGTYAEYEWGSLKVGYVTQMDLRGSFQLTLFC